MAKFLRVGPNPKNKIVPSSKGWTVRRRGRVVLLRWGSVEVKGYGLGRRFCWAGTAKQKIVRFRSENKARAYMKRRIAVRESHGYEKLPGSVRINRAEKCRL